MTTCVAARPAGVFIASGFANETPPIGTLPPALAAGAPVVGLADQVVLGECAQVIARRAARLAEPLGERARGLRPVLAEDVVDPHPQRVRERPKRAGVEDAVLAVALLGAGRVVHRLCALGCCSSMPPR